VTDERPKAFPSAQAFRGLTDCDTHHMVTRIACLIREASLDDVSANLNAMYFFSSRTDEDSASVYKRYAACDSSKLRSRRGSLILEYAMYFLSISLGFECRTCAEFALPHWLSLHRRYRHGRGRRRLQAKIKNPVPLRVVSDVRPNNN
jgi:hypothetical protein